MGLDKEAVDFVTADARFRSRTGQARKLGEFHLSNVEVTEEMLLFSGEVLVDAAHCYWFFQGF